MRSYKLSHLFQTPPSGIFAEPHEVAVNVRYLPQDADLVAVEVVGLLVAFALFVGTVAYLRQWFVGIRVSVDMDIPAVRVGFLQEVATVPNEVGFIFKVV